MPQLLYILNGVMPNLYFDNASTSYPKPPEVAREIARFMNETGGTYARGAYARAVESSRMAETCRDMLLDKIGGSADGHIVFTFNATDASNMLLFGLGLHDCRVMVSPLEHNAVMRPLEWLRRNRGVKWEMLPAGADGRVDCEALRTVDLTGVRLIVVNHQSNVNGVIQPVREIKDIAGGVAVAVDASQSLGHIDVDADGMGADFLFFTGHKGLLGPTGTGGLYIRAGAEVAPLRYGGTAALSYSLDMPGLMPDRLEAGTPNMAGIAGLLAALEHPAAAVHTKRDFIHLLNEVRHTDGIKVYCADEEEYQGELFSFTHERLTPPEIAEMLSDRFGIECRSGIHCAPSAHAYLNTGAGGTVRLSLSAYHTPEDLDYLINSIKVICV